MWDGATTGFGDGGAILEWGWGGRLGNVEAYG